jgi:hypothetical protein
MVDQIPDNRPLELRCPDRFVTGWENVIQNRLSLFAPTALTNAQLVSQGFDHITRSSFFLWSRFAFSIRTKVVAYRLGVIWSGRPHLTLLPRNEIFRTTVWAIGLPVTQLELTSVFLDLMPLAETGVLAFAVIIHSVISTPIMLAGVAPSQHSSSLNVNRMKNGSQVQGWLVSYVALYGASVPFVIRKNISSHPQTAKLQLLGQISSSR